MEERTCRVCASPYVVSDGEIEWMAQRDFPIPRRCPDCRKRGLRHRPNGKAASEAHATAERALSGQAT